MADNIPVEGNLDLKGNELKNVAIEVVTSLPTTNNFEGRHVTYQGRSCIWDGTEWKCDTIKLPPIPVNSEDRYKYINHRLGRKPDVQLIDESGEIRYVQVIHLSDDSLQLSWVGSIVGSVIIN